MKTVLELVSEHLAQRRLQALLIGGYALQAYGVVRQTVDVDFLIAENDSANFHRILAKAGLSETARTENFVRYTHTSVYLMDVDILLVDQPTFDKLLESSCPYHIGNYEIRVPSLPHLIALKLHATKNRPERELNDMTDIVSLLRANPGIVAENELRTLCEKYGSEGIFSKLEEYL